MASNQLTFIDVVAQDDAREEARDGADEHANWQAVVGIRQQVFVVEQSCPPEEEFDAHDPTCQHVLGLVDDAPIATARWRLVDHHGQQVAKLERFAVLAEHRGRGHGVELVRHLMQAARAAGQPTLYIHAQEYLRKFYQGLGFEVCGERFDEAGIPHLPMICRQ